jgi:hypothetical protein
MVSLSKWEGMWCLREAPTLSGAKGTKRRQGLGNGQRSALEGRGVFDTVWRDYLRARSGGRDVRRVQGT